MNHRQTLEWERGVEVVQSSLSGSIERGSTRSILTGDSSSMTTSAKTLPSTCTAETKKNSIDRRLSNKKRKATSQQTQYGRTINHSGICQNDSLLRNQQRSIVPRRPASLDSLCKSKNINLHIGSNHNYIHKNNNSNYNAKPMYSDKNLASVAFNHRSGLQNLAMEATRMAMTGNYGSKDNINTMLDNNRNKCSACHNNNNSTKLSRKSSSKPTTRTEMSPAMRASMSTSFLGLNSTVNLPTFHSTLNSLNKLHGNNCDCSHNDNEDTAGRPRKRLASLDASFCSGGGGQNASFSIFPSSTSTAKATAPSECTVTETISPLSPLLPIKSAQLHEQQRQLLLQGVVSDIRKNSDGENDIHNVNSQLHDLAKSAIAKDFASKMNKAVLIKEQLEGVQARRIDNFSGGNDGNKTNESPSTTAATDKRSSSLSPVQERNNEEKAQEQQEHTSTADEMIHKCEIELRASKMLLGNHPKLAEPLSRLALIHQHLIRDHKVALQYHTISLNCLLDATNREPYHSTRDIYKEIGVTLIDMAQVHEVLAQHEAALEKYWEAIRLFKCIGVSQVDVSYHSANQGINRLCRCSARSSSDPTKCICNNIDKNDVHTTTSNNDEATKDNEENQTNDNSDDEDVTTDGDGDCSNDENNDRDNDASPLSQQDKLLLEGNYVCTHSCKHKHHHNYSAFTNMVRVPSSVQQLVQSK